MLNALRDLVLGSESELGVLAERSLSLEPRSPNINIGLVDTNDVEFVDYEGDRHAWIGSTKRVEFEITGTGTLVGVFASTEKKKKGIGDASPVLPFKEPIGVFADDLVRVRIHIADFLEN